MTDIVEINTTSESVIEVHDGVDAATVAAVNAHVADANNPHGVTKAQVGLGNVDNTSDLNKPISTATQTALDGKEPTIAVGETSQYFRGDKTWRDFFTDVRTATLTGLSTATNAVITATDTVLGALGKLQKQVSDNLSTLTSHTGNVNNPHSVTKAQVGLSNVDNTSDANKPISTATLAALNAKVDNATSRASIRPSLLLAFGNSERVDSRITFTRASTAMRTNRLGVLESVAANQPRIDYDPITGECKGLLIEEQRTNLLTYSEQFDNAAWVKSGASVTANAITAPDGLLSADKLVESAAAAVHFLNELMTVAAGGVYAVSIFAKAGERSSLQVGYDDGGSNGVYAAFDLSTGTVSQAATVRGTGTATSASISAVGGGWYRCVVVGVAGPSATTARISAIATTGGLGWAPSYTGDGTSGLYVWGAQLEAGSFATSYIPTTSAQATRAAEVPVNSALSPWFNSGEWTVYAELNIPQVNGTVAWRAFEFDDGSGSVRARCNGASTWVFDDTSTLSAGFGTGIATGAARVAVAYKSNDAAACVNGGTVATDTTVTPLSGLNRLTIGASSLTSSRQINGHIKRLAYYPRRLSNAELQGLTS